MFRAIKYVLFGVTALLVVAIGSPLLAILGRSAGPRRGELVVDPDLLGPDDPGVDVDAITEDERTP